MRILMLAAALMLAACGANPIKATRHFEVVPGSMTGQSVERIGSVDVWYAGGGGVVEDQGALTGIVDDMRRRTEEGQFQIFNGKMVSAHAYGEGNALAVPRPGEAWAGCWGPRNVWSPHASSSLGVRVLPAYTRQQAQTWHPGLRDWFLGRTHRYRWMTYPEVCGPDVPYPERLRCDAWLADLAPDASCAAQGVTIPED